MKQAKTNAMRLLDKLGIAYRAMEYDTADGQIDGMAVAQKTGQPPHTVFKTLLARGADGGVLVFCLPVNRELDLKRAARAAGQKSVHLLPLADITPASGYVRGGVSPLAMKKPYPTFLDTAAQALDTVVVSGGRVGTQVALAPADLLQAAGAAWMA